MTQTHPYPLMKTQDRTCCGVVHEAREVAREKRYNRTTPQPWIARKMVVGIAVGIMGYSAYVYIQRLCIAMIRGEKRAQGGRSTGIVLLVIFCVLYLWMIWAYIMVVLTPPGYAKDYIRQSERPLMLAVAPIRESFQSSNIPDTDIETGNRNSQQSQGPSLTKTMSRSQLSHRNEPTGLAGPSYEDLLRRDESRRSETQDRSAGQFNAVTVPKPAFIPPIAAVSSHLGAPALNTSLSNGTSSNKANPKTYPKRDKARMREQKLAALNITRRPPTTPVLDPVHRYCSTDRIVKPYRTHHCRACGTCVLKYDHHCPWIGQCVGARNHKFFINFNQAAVAFTAYVLATLLAYTIKAGDSPTLGIDAQEIVVIALAGIFLLFTFLLLASHIMLILRGQTTVESLQTRNMKERESRLLAKGLSWWQFGAKKRLRREWDNEWGTIDREGNIWWLGDSHDEWVSVMGKWWLGWFLPVGRCDNDGLTYPVNPRFDANGRWRRRAEWPEGLR